MKILIATKNPGKAREIKSFLGKDFSAEGPGEGSRRGTSAGNRLGPASGWEVVSLNDFPNAPDIEETGKTFEENAILKAKKYFEWLNVQQVQQVQQGSSLYNNDDPCVGCVADDSGLEIDYLNGEPGVKSRRWLGYEMIDQEMIDTALEKLKGVPIEKRTAHLVAVGAYYDGKEIIIEKGVIKGYVTEEQVGQCDPGYPFDAIFWVPRLNKSYLELKHEKNEAINHRKILYKKLAAKIENP